MVSGLAGKVCRVGAVWLVLGAFVNGAFAQAAREAKVIVSVVDPTGGLIPGATVTLVGLESATKAFPSTPVRTSDKGVVTIERVTPGRYSLQAEFSGFALGLVPDMRITAGENKRVIMLPFKNLQESVTVGGGQESAASRTTQAFGMALTNEQVDALSDDKDELARQIAELGGPDAIIRVDSFEGQQLPPKSQIKSIHVTRDQFAAETEQPGSTFVDVITAAGVGKFRGNINTSYHNGRWNGQNPFLTAGTRTPEQQHSYGANISGALIKDRADFSLSVNAQGQNANPILNSSGISGSPSKVLNAKQGYDYVNVNGLFNYALTRDQTLRVGYSQYRYTADGGVGGYAGPEMASSDTEHYYSFRVQEAGPIGRRIFINSRLSVNWDNDQYASVTDAIKIVAPTLVTGGAQQKGGIRARNFNFASDVDYVRGIHSWRAGVIAYGGSYRTDQRSNYLGTYTFATDDDYLAGRPSQFSIELGNPSFSYFNAQGAAYIQDDIRVRKSLTLSPGVRYSAQTRIHDPGALEPRFGLTWAPFKAGKTTLRASAGTFHGWLSPYVLAQAIRLDGSHQQQLLISNPSYPTLPDLSSGTVRPPTKYEIGSYQLQANVRYSGGIDQVLSPRLRMSVLYNYIHQKQIPRGSDLNPLVNGVRPDPAFGSIVATVTDAEVRRHELYTTFNFNLAPQGQGGTAKVFDWRRITAVGSYSWIRARRNAADAFSVPPTGTLDAEWGPGPADQPYRINASINSTQIRSVSINLNLSLNAGQVYSETTGFDDNGDGFFNDRPVSVGLNSLRQPGRETATLRVSYTLPLGTTPAPNAPSRFKPNVFLSVNNLTNHTNYTGYSGVQSNQATFMQPTAVAGTRSLSTGLSMSF
ncbi:MAG: TonB-dependent receptor [Acidobacteriota bacterium]